MTPVHGNFGSPFWTFRYAKRGALKLAWKVKPNRERESLAALCCCQSPSSESYLITLKAPTRVAKWRWSYRLTKSWEVFGA
jgi:hypothetical protein